MPKNSHIIAVMIAIAASLFVSCSKDSNPMNGTSWVSTYSENCDMENEYLTGDFSEVLSFDNSKVNSMTLKNGYTYRQNYSCEYTFADDRVTFYRHSDTISFRVNENVMTQLNTGIFKRYVFYKQ